MQMINSKPSNPSSEAFVEPQLAPPVHSHEVTKPLMSELVSHNICDTVLVALIGLLLVKQNGGGSYRETLIPWKKNGELIDKVISLPIRNEAPVFHCSVRLQT
jgi:hypothetical protein